MRERIGVRRHAITAAYEPQTTCPTCHGAQGHVVTTWDEDGTRRDQFVPCPTCHGAGVR